jgi:hypothetical protein
MEGHQLSPDLEARLTSLKHAEPDAVYYTMTLLGENGKIIWASQTHWTGFTETEPRRELRAPRRVYAKFAELWDDLKQPYIFVHNVDELFLYWLTGGHALIEQSLFESVFQEFLKPFVSIPDGKWGYSGEDLFDEVAFRRSPTPKLRMKILQRDQRRCRICGRRPDDHVDVELHVHHVRPWARGGVTDPGNLITLCHTCHSGLEPHEDLSLFDYINHKRRVRLMMS